MLDRMLAHARARGVSWQPALATPYQNTIPVQAQPTFPGDLAIEERLASIMRWNALAMVARANASYGELGGHRQLCQRGRSRWGSITSSARRSHRRQRPRRTGQWAIWCSFSRTVRLVFTRGRFLKVA